MLNVPLPRLLPTTITVMASLLVLKSVVLLQGAVTHGQRPEGVMVAAASAAGAEHIKEAPKPVPATPPTPPPLAAGQKAGSAHEGGAQHGASPQGASPHGAAQPGAAQPGGAQPGDAAPPGAGQPVADAVPPMSDSEKALLQELRQRRKELEARADAITTRESMLVAAEQKLGARVAELQSLQKRLENLEGAQKQKEDAGWQGIVKLYEAMKPKEAATIFNELSMPVLLQVLDRMKDAKAAAVMAAMSPDKARDVTDGLAQLRTGRDPSATAATKFNALGS